MYYDEIIYPEDNTKLRAFYHKSSWELPNMDRRPAVVICPGGGYVMTSEREADIVAEQFLAAGFQAFVFTYSTNEGAEFPRPLIELSRAMKDIRANTEKWNLDPDRIAVGGFSAGGHLAASLATLWNDPEIMRESGCENGENRPNLSILGYPVITTSWMKADQHPNGYDRVLGNRREEDVLPKIDICRNVGEQTPPAFIFHTFTDNVVPVEDSLIYAAALAKYDIPFDLHIFSNSLHGMSIGQNISGWYDREYSKWVELCIGWLKRMWQLDGSGNLDDPKARRHLNEDYKGKI